MFKLFQLTDAEFWNDVQSKYRLALTKLMEQKPKDSKLVELDKWFHEEELKSTQALLLKDENELKHWIAKILDWKLAVFKKLK